MRRGIGSRELPRSWLVRLAGTLGQGRSGMARWNGSQPGQGALNCIPRPALWQMQGDAACRAGETSVLRRRRSEGPGGHAFTHDACPAGRLLAGNEAPLAWFGMYLIRPNRSISRFNCGANDMAKRALRTGSDFLRAEELGSPMGEIVSAEAAPSC